MRLSIRRGVHVMKSSTAIRIVTRCVFIVAALLALRGVGLAQEVAVTGTVTDSTGGVLPGVVVQAVHEESGNHFETVTDDSGRYRLPVRVGSYRLSAELPGFATFTRTGLEILVGQQIVVNISMVPSSVQESVW